jgi:hypothetical protein
MSAKRTGCILSHRWSVILCYVFVLMMSHSFVTVQSTTGCIKLSVGILYFPTIIP